MKIVLYLKMAEDYRSLAAVDQSQCEGCGICVKICPFGVPFLSKDNKAKISAGKCIGCGACVALCKTKAICIRRMLNTIPYTDSETEPAKGQYFIDRNAVEAGLDLRDKSGGELWIMGMGPPQCVEAVREGLAMDADEGVFLCDEKFLGSDHGAIALIIAKALEKIGGCDLLLTPHDDKSPEGSLALAWAAQKMGMTYLPHVRELEINRDHVLARRQSDEREMDEFSLCLPAAVSMVARNSQTPRGLSMMAAARAMQKQVPVWPLADLGLSQSQVGEAASSIGLVSVEAPVFKKKSRRSAQMLQGPPQEASRALVEILGKWGISHTAAR